MKRILAQLLLLTFCHVTSHAQSEREQVYLHLDKYQCWAGDSIYFSGYVNYKGTRSIVSTNLYVDLWTERGSLAYRGMFPVVDGLAIGNFKVPVSLVTGNYVLRALTAQQTNFDSSNFFMVPIAVYNKDKPARTVHKSRMPPLNAAAYVNLGDVRVNINKYKDSIAVLLDMDTTCSAKRLTVIHPLTTNSGSYASLWLQPDHPSRYVLFPIDTSKEVQNILIQEDSRLIAKVYLNLNDAKKDTLISIIPDTLDERAGGYNSWQVTLPDSLQWISSVAVTPANRSVSPPVNIYALKDTWTESLRVPVKLVDTSFVTFSGNIRKKYRNKVIKDPFSKTIAFAGIKDTSYVFLRNVEQDDRGNFKLDSLLFYGKIKIQFRLNKMEDGSNDNIRMELNRYVPPSFDTTEYQQFWNDDSSKIAVDTVYTETETRRYDISKIKTLKPVIVKHYKSPRQELDNRYAEGPLSEPMAYSFDVRTETRYYYIADFLRAQFGTEFRGGYSSNDTPLDMHGQPIMFYLDGELEPWWMIYGIDFKRLAYVKGGTLTGFQETPFERFQMGENVSSRFSYDSGKIGAPTQNDPFVIGIYTRKGNDWRSMPSEVNSIEVTGYDELWKFSQDRITLFWDPIMIGKTFRIRFNNNENTAGFRIVVEGIDQKGEVIHREQIVN